MFSKTFAVTLKLNSTNEDLQELLKIYLKENISLVSLSCFTYLLFAIIFYGLCVRRCCSLRNVCHWWGFIIKLFLLFNTFLWKSKTNPKTKKDKNNENYYIIKLNDCFTKMLFLWLLKLYYLSNFLGNLNSSMQRNDDHVKPKTWTMNFVRRHFTCERDIFIANLLQQANHIK